MPSPAESTDPRSRSTPSLKQPVATYLGAALRSSAAIRCALRSSRPPKARMSSCAGSPWSGCCEATVPPFAIGGGGACDGAGVLGGGTAVPCAAGGGSPPAIWDSATIATTPIREAPSYWARLLSGFPAISTCGLIATSPPISSAIGGAEGASSYSGTTRPPEVSGGGSDGSTPPS